MRARLHGKQSAKQMMHCLMNAAADCLSDKSQLNLLRQHQHQRIQQILRHPSTCAQGSPSTPAHKSKISHETSVKKHPRAATTLIPCHVGKVHNSLLRLLLPFIFAPLLLLQERDQRYKEKQRRGRETF